MKTGQPTTRTFNLILTAFCLLTGLAFGSVAFWEGNLTAKLDDLGLLALGIILLLWYLVRKNRFRRSLVPVVIILLTVPLQAWGLMNEINDRAAVVNDIGGIYVYVPVAFIAVYGYFRLSRAPTSRPPA